MWSIFIGQNGLECNWTVEHLPSVEDHHEALGRRADGDGAVVLGVEVVGEGLGVAAARTPSLPHNLREPGYFLS